MAVGTLLVFDASLPGGLIAGSRYALRETMAFTTLMLFQLFNALNARSDEHSAFLGLSRIGWLWAAIGGSIALQVDGVCTVSPACVRDDWAERPRLGVLCQWRARSCGFGKEASWWREGRIQGARRGWITSQLLTQDHRFPYSVKT